MYVHIPYCRQLCPYCDFNVHVARKEPPWDRLTEALLAQWQAQRGAFGAGPVRTVYFGGGTPSLAPPRLFAAVLQALQRDVGVQPEAEITVEVDPGTISTTELRELHHLGINRVSLGWQSTHDHLLRTLGRGHDARQSRETLAAVREAGLQEISVDLIFAVPGQTLEHLQADLRALVALAPQHVSLYGLTYHEGTAFARRRQRGLLTPVPEPLEVEMMAQAESALTEAGYRRYEVSSYALPGHEARHNGGYWDGVPYLGLGPGAHSFLRHGWSRGWRWEAARRPERYFAAWIGTPVLEGPPPPEHPGITFVEELSARVLRGERMMCGLRRLCGVSLREEALVDHGAELQPGIEEGIRRGWLMREGDRVRPTAAGLLFGDDLGALWL